MEDAARPHLRQTRSAVFASRDEVRALQRLEFTTAVVVDVLRAFTTAAIAFERGAERIVLAASEREAILVKKQIPGSLTLGEQLGQCIGRFDMSNSPSELLERSFEGRTLIQISTHGTPAVLETVPGVTGNTYCASLLCAAKTASTVEGECERCLYVISGWRQGIDVNYGDDDLAVAEYIESRRHSAGDPAPYIDRIRKSPSAWKFLDKDQPEMPTSDLDIAVQVNRDGFVMPVTVGPYGPELRCRHV